MGAGKFSYKRIMNEPKKFVIRKPSSLLRAKISSNDELLFKNQNNSGLATLNPLDNLQSFEIEGVSFFSKDQKIIKRQSTNKFSSEIFVAKYGPDDSKILTTFLDGSITIVNNKDSNKNISSFINDGVPITCAVWKDNKSFLIGDTEGNIYDIEFEKNSSDITIVNKVEDSNEQILALDYSKSMAITAYAGKSMNITIMSDQTKKVIKVFEAGDSFTHGHTNRIFSLKFSETNPQVFISAGWDGTMFLWDIRTNKAVNEVYGPILSGDSLDIKDNIILAGSYRDKDSLELYDMRLFKKICNIEWNLGKSGFNYISSCKFNRNTAGGDLIIAGSCLSNQVGIFKKDIVYNQDLLMTGMKTGVYSVGFSSTENKFFYATNDGDLSLYHYFSL
jgi:COMPASS component SWD3